MREKEINFDSNFVKVSFQNNHLDYVFHSSHYPKLKTYFDDYKLREKSLYYVLVEDLYDTIKLEVVIKRLALTTFHFTDVKNLILSLTNKMDNFYGIKGFLKRSKIYYEWHKFIIPNAEPLENEYYQVRDLIESIEISLSDDYC